LVRSIESAPVVSDFDANFPGLKEQPDDDFSGVSVCAGISERFFSHQNEVPINSWIKGGSRAFRFGLDLDASFRAELVQLSKGVR
jgi:hypothetical protein